MNDEVLVVFRPHVDILSPSEIQKAFSKDRVDPREVQCVKPNSENWKLGLEYLAQLQLHAGSVEPETEHQVSDFMKSLNKPVKYFDCLKCLKFPFLDSLWCVS